MTKQLVPHSMVSWLEIEQKGFPSFSILSSALWSLRTVSKYSPLILFLCGWFCLFDLSPQETSEFLYANLLVPEDFSASFLCRVT